MKGLVRKPFDLDPILEENQLPGVLRPEVLDLFGLLA